MCQIKLLIIGNSDPRNRNIAKQIMDAFVSLDNDIQIQTMVCNPKNHELSPDSDCDLAIIEEDSWISKSVKCILSSGVPVIEFQDVIYRDWVNDPDHITFKTINQVVNYSKLKEHIVKTTDALTDVHHRFLQCCCEQS